MRQGHARKAPRLALATRQIWRLSDGTGCPENCAKWNSILLIPWWLITITQPNRARTSMSFSIAICNNTTRQIGRCTEDRNQPQTESLVKRICTVWWNRRRLASWKYWKKWDWLSWGRFLFHSVSGCAADQIIDPSFVGRSQAQGDAKGGTCGCHLNLKNLCLEVIILCSNWNISRELVRFRCHGASSPLPPEGRVQVLRSCKYVERDRSRSQLGKANQPNV